MQVIFIANITVLLICLYTGDFSFNQKSEMPDLFFFYQNMLVVNYKSEIQISLLMLSY